MTLIEFLQYRFGRLILQASLAAATAAFLLLTGTQADILILLLLLWGMFSVLIQTYDFLKYRGHIRELAAIMDGLDQKFLFTECIPRPDNVYEQALYDLIRQSGKSMIEAVSNARAAQKEYKEYVESWVHEIKTPITAARLICQAADKETRRKLTAELAQIDNHVERALYYARAENPEQDFLIRQVSLEELVAEAIERHRSLLIQNSVRIETESLNHVVYTDGKWVCFMLGQLLQNAVRYRSSKPVITLTARDAGTRVQFIVSDNGIGIPSHELSRVFTRGFTGSNGRSRGGSTGMGLYLCKKLAEHLEICLDIQSTEGQGTCLTLTFPARKPNLSNL